MVQFEKEGLSLDNAVLSSRMSGNEEKARDRKKGIDAAKQKKRGSRKYSAKEKGNIGKQRY